MGIASFPGLERSERGADHPPPSAGVRMGWNYTSSPPLFLLRHIMGWHDQVICKTCREAIRVRGSLGIILCDPQVGNQWNRIEEERKKEEIGHVIFCCLVCHQRLSVNNSLLQEQISHSVTFIFSLNYHYLERNFRSRESGYLFVPCLKSPQSADMSVVTD
jgi:hypothetical protein